MSFSETYKGFEIYSNTHSTSKTAAVKIKYLRPKNHWNDEIGRYVVSRGIPNSLLQKAKTMIDEEVEVLSRFRINGLSILPYVRRTTVPELKGWKAICKRYENNDIIEIKKKIRKGNWKYIGFIQYDGSLSIWIREFQSGSWGFPQEDGSLKWINEKGHYEIVIKTFKQEEYGSSVKGALGFCAEYLKNS